MGVLDRAAENKPLEPDTCNQVVGKVVVDFSIIPLVPDPVHLSRLMHPVRFIEDTLF